MDSLEPEEAVGPPGVIVQGAGGCGLKLRQMLLSAVLLTVPAAAATAQWWVELAERVRLAGESVEARREGMAAKDRKFGNTYILVTRGA